MIQKLLIVVAVYLIATILFFLWIWGADAWRYNRMNHHKVNPRTWVGVKWYFTLSFLWPLIALGGLISAVEKVKSSFKPEDK